MKKFNLIEHNYKGKLIVFEGIDGAGKTTLLQKAEAFLKESGKICYVTKMPSERMRNLSIFHDYDNSKEDTIRKTVNLTNLTIMVTGDRLLTLDTEIIPALEKGYYVLCDRYCYTGYIRCEDDIIYSISQRFLKPDITFLASVSLETAKNRVKARKKEKDYFYDEMGVKKQKEDFLSLAKLNQFIVIDTEEKKTEVEERLINNLKQIL